MTTTPLGRDATAPSTGPWRWWHDAVIYQIYPRSFFDTDGDGVGDLAGITAKMDYLADLGVDCLWLSPFYPSPMKDFGYDVSDYCNVDPVFGDLDTFDELVGAAHERGIRVILDWVPNHTSSEHPWFVDARSSRDAAHREFYVWREPTADGAPPNNWLRSWSDESAWTLDDATGQWYLHCFLADQPDLNWANTEVRAAMADTLRFWLRRGVDGFRMDVIHLIGKDPTLPDDPPEIRGIGHVPLNDRPETHGYLREIRAVLEESGPEIMSVGEVYLLDPAAVAQYVREGELHLSFNFASLLTRWRAEDWRALIEQTETSFNGVAAWPTWVLSNHDNMRVASRLKLDPQRIRAAMVLLLTLRGTPFLYAGEELGLPDADVPADRVVDPGLRDNCRAPFPWTTDAHYGWPSEPWLPFADGADRDAESVQRGDPHSMLEFTRTLLQLRKSRDELRRGALVGLRTEGDLLRFERNDGAHHASIVVNFGRTDVDVTVPPGEQLSVTTAHGGATGAAVTLPAGGAAVFIRSEAP